MEITEKNAGKYLGFIDDKNAIFINESNYKEKFSEFLQNPDNPRWEQIAEKGNEYSLKHFSNDNAVEQLIHLMEEVICT